MNYNNSCMPISNVQLLFRLARWYYSKPCKKAANSANTCDLLHCLTTRLGLSANQNAGLLFKFNSANHGVV